MNFLAHVHLSGADEDVLVGNFIGDFVKGREMHRYPDRVTQGIRLHRLIDQFTDDHLVVGKSKARLRSRYRHYAGVIVDVFYDHLLARDWNDFNDTDLREFAQATYQTISNRLTALPERVGYMLPYMIRHDWLYNYRHINGIRRTLEGMSRRTRFNSHMEESYLDLIEHYNLFREEFRSFYPDLQEVARTFLLKQGLPS